MKKILLRPYNGCVFVAKTQNEYERQHKRIFKRNDIINGSIEGRFSGEEDKNGTWTYLIWGKKHHNLAHELSHVILHTFYRSGIDPRECNGEPFCYMLSQLLLDAY